MPRQGRRERRIGRFTASLLLVGVGILLFRDWLRETDDMLLLLKWWPAVPVIWGVEYLLIYGLARRPRRAGAGPGFRLDFRGLLPAILLGASVFIVSEQEHYLHLWNKVSLNLTAAAVDYGEAKGSKLQKPVLKVPVELRSAKLTVDAINGDIVVHRSPIDDIEVTATVWVDQLNGARAEAVSDQSFIEVSEGATIKLATKGKAYGESGKRQPRMDLDIAVPDSRRFNLDITTMNGGITLQNTEAIQDINLETGNGPIILHKVFGNIKGKTHNGDVRVREIQGDVDFVTSGGDIRAWDVSGRLKLSTAVGNISAERSGADIEVSTKNGNVEVNGARSVLNAQSLNGIIDIRSPYVQADWNIYSAVGDINLFLPAEGNYSINGSSGYGDIVTDFTELVIDKKTVSGKIGTGEFKVDVEGNSNLNVRKN
ncbi:protein liaG [Paenibacillus rhizophilus]|uniref:Protein liaG n=2 Tax=Paenibacillus rhizophilus TaxID=1850366 RepID=A0A3N9P286_9BACL|nr:protein liaG [Paenibacillus rhizophilus]